MEGVKVSKSLDEVMAPYRADKSAEARDARDVFSEVYSISGSLIAARVARGLTQVQLSALSGVQQADISRIENGNILPNTTTLAKLTRALHARINIELISENDDFEVKELAYGSSERGSQ